MIAEKAKETAKQIWNFFRAAGVLQAVVDGKAFRNLRELPNENWAVLSCPTTGLDFDSKTLAFIDGNGDGHIRIEEVLGALAWLEPRLADLGELQGGTDTVKLASFADTAEGKALKEAAKAVLERVGKADSDSISLADVMSRQATFKAAPFNGDGVLVPEAAKDDGLEGLVGEIIKVTGGIGDRSGADGVDKATLDSFYATCAAWLGWLDAGRADSAKVFPAGDGTEAGLAALESVRAKIDDYFERCALIDFDEAALTPLNSSQDDYAAIGGKTISCGDAAVENLPLAKATEDCRLDFAKGLNPAWRGRMAAFAEKAVKPVLGERTAMSDEDWCLVKNAYAPYIAWKGAMAGGAAAQLGEERVRAIVADSESHGKIEALIAKDIGYSGEINQLDDLEKLLRYHANLERFLNNFVNFSDYYNPDVGEIYRAGRLYIDGRVCRECVYVADAGAHSTLAASSKMLLLYCGITRPQTGEKKTVCAAVTAGFASTLWVGRNGIFYDAEGKDWNAVIIKICESQTSLKEAFWAPWIKICDLVNDQIKKLLSSKETAMMSAATTKVGTIGAESAPPQAEQKRDGAAMASSVAAIGIALGIIGSAIGGLITALKGISFWYGVLGALALILVVSGPSVILAWFKLRARDFAPVLNACGWAINKKMRMPMRLSRVFTHEAVVPEGSSIDMEDPYVEKHFWRNLLIVFLLVAAAIFAVWMWRYTWIPEQYWPSFMQKAKPATGEVAASEQAAEAAAEAEAVAPAAPPPASPSLPDAPAAPQP